MLSVLAGIIPAATKSKSVMCLHVGRSTVKDSEIAAEVWHKHKLHQVFLNPTMM